MKYIFILVSAIISIVTVLFAGYALVSVMRGIVRRGFRLGNVMTACICYFGWFIVLSLSFSVVACGMLFIGNYILEFFSVSETSIVWGAWISGLFLMSALFSAGITSFLWRLWRVKATNSN